MKRYTRYLTTQLLTNILGVLSFVLSFHLLIRVAESGNYDWDSIFGYLLEIPNTILLFLPIAILIGSLLALGNMNSRNEITAMRASGASRTQIAVPLFVICLGLAVIMMVTMELLVPKIYQAAGIDAQSRVQQSWQKLDDGYANVTTLAEPSNSDDNNGNTNALYRLDLFDHANQTNIEQAYFDTRIEEGSDVFSVAPQKSADFSPQRDQIIANLSTQSVSLSQPLSQAQRRLPVQANYGLQPSSGWQRVQALKRSGQPYQNEANELWRLLLLPLTYLSVAVVTLPFAFSTARNARVGKRLFAGILIGLAFYVVSRLVGSLALVYPIHPALAIATAPVLFMLVALWWINNRI